MQLMESTSRRSISDIFVDREKNTFANRQKFDMIKSTIVGIEAIHEGKKSVLDQRRGH